MHFAERQRVETSMLSGEIRYKIVRFISDEAWILAHMRKNMYLCKIINFDKNIDTGLSRIDYGKKTIKRRYKRHELPTLS